MSAPFSTRLAFGVVVLLASFPAFAGKDRVALHPVVVIGAGVPETAATAMTQALVDELKAAELQPIIVQDIASAEPAPVVKPEATKVDPTADKKLAEGRKALQKLQLPKAITLLDSAVAGFAGDDKRTADAALLLAEAHYRRGDEAKGRKALEQVARAAPATKLDAKKYPPVFISAFKEVRSRVAKDSRLQATPVEATPVGRDVRAGIMANKCDATVRTRALALTRAPAADLVVVLGIGNGERFFTMGGFVGDARSGRWAVLPVVKLDAAMLSANIEAGKLARELASQAKRFTPGSVVGTLPFVDGLVEPQQPVAVTAREPVAERRPLNDATAFATFSPPIQQEPGPLTRASATDQLDHDSALAADLAALAGYDAPAYSAMPLEATAEMKHDGITSKWWFWTAVGVGAAVVGGTTYYLMSHGGASDRVQVQAAW